MLQRTLFFPSREWDWLVCCKWEVKLCKCILLGHSRRDLPSFWYLSIGQFSLQRLLQQHLKALHIKMNAPLQSFFFHHPVPASLPTYPFNHSHIHLDFGSKREKDWITDWHNNSRKQSGVWEVGRICGPMGWCNEKQNFLTPELCDPLKPWNPASLFLAEFPPKPHTNLNVCAHTQAHTHNILPPSLPPAPTFSLTIWTFQRGQSVLEALTKCHVLLVNVSLIEVTAEDIDVHR